MTTIRWQNTDENKERKIAILASAIFISILLITSCFIRLFIHIPLPVDLPPLRSDEVIEEFIIDKEDIEIAQTGGSSGGGTENNAPVNPVKTTNPSVSEGKGFSDTTKNGNNSALNPFGTGGTGGGNGTGGGKLGGPGDRPGDGDPGGGGGGGDPTPGNRITKDVLNQEGIVTDVDITINLKLIINSSGKVVSATNIASKTTTTNNRIINKVISEVMKQIKYDEKKNADLEYVYITCKIRAQ
jgi:hypothetical protein